ncbi:MAG: ABC transporter permease [Alphaproteobacteria bacterium]
MNIIASLARKPWIWAYLGALAVWLTTLVFNDGRGGGGLLSAALTFGTFFVIVGIGQMFVITLGPGNIDLSIPANMTLAGTVSMKLMDGANAMIPVGIAAAFGVGIGVGVFNYGLIRFLRIPPIIATLSASFIFLSAAIWYNRGLRIKPPPALGDFTTAKILGVPLIALLVIVLALVMTIVLDRTVFGRSIIAIGQNVRAARLAGVATELVKFATYVQCAVLAALGGFLLSGFSGGAALNMGADYLLNSIAVVVIGGTSVAGGFSNVPGLWGAALFLFLLVAMLNTFGLDAGYRLILTGVIIISVIVVAGGSKFSGK